MNAMAMSSTPLPARRPDRAMARWLLATLMLLATMLTGGSAWARDDGDWQILNARYGTPQHNIDVTGRLKELARSDDRVRVTNGLFGDDPDVGRSKVLRIYARNRDGGTRVFEFREGNVIDGNDFTGWRGGEWGQGGGSGHQEQRVEVGAQDQQHGGRRHQEGGR